MIQASRGSIPDLICGVCLNRRFEFGAPFERPKSAQNWPKTLNYSKAFLPILAKFSNQPKSQILTPLRKANSVGVVSTLDWLSQVRNMRPHSAPTEREIFEAEFLTGHCVFQLAAAIS